VRQVGYSTILMGGVRDLYILAQLNGWLAQLDDNNHSWSSQPRSWENRSK
jgi:hypothetical protein